MSLRQPDYDSVRDWLSAAEKGDLIETKGPPPSGTTYGWGGGPAFSDAFNFRRAPSLPALAEAYKSLIFTCCRLNADAVARIPLRLYKISDKKGDRTSKSYDSRPVTKSTVAHLRKFPTTTKALAGAEEVEEITGDHPLLQLIQNVNPAMDHAALINYTVMSMDVVGTSFWWPTEEFLGCPREFWALPPHLVYPNMAAGTLMPVSYWFGAVEYKPEDLVIFKHLSLKNPYGLGMSPTQAAIEYARLEDVFVSAQDDLMSNGPRPSVIISHKDPQGSFGTAERQRFENDLNRRGRGGRSGAAFVVDGAVSVTPVSWSPADLGAVEISRYDMERTCGCFGVPISMVTNESSNRAVAEAGLEQHARNAVEPRCKNIASTLTRWTHELDGNGKRNWHKLFWAFDDCVPEDKKAKADLDKTYIDMGVLTRNEVRVEDGHEPVENGDVVLVSNSLATLDSIINPPKPEPAPGLPGEVPADADDTAQPGEPEEEIEGDGDNEVEEEAEETDETDGEDEGGDGADEGEEEDPESTGESEGDDEDTDYAVYEDDEEEERKSIEIADLSSAILCKIAAITGQPVPGVIWVWDPILKRATPCRDERGRFASCGGGSGAGKKPPGKPATSGSKPRKPRAPKTPKDSAGKPAKTPKKPAEKPAKPGDKPATDKPAKPGKPAADKPGDKPAKPASDKPAKEKPAKPGKPDAKPEATPQSSGATTKIPHTDPNLPEHKEQIGFIKEDHAVAAKEIGSQLGMSGEAVQAKIGQNIKEAIDHGDFYVRANSDVLPHILKDARFKSQFETASSGGALDVHDRIDTEARMLATPGKTPASSRPIYGYVSTKDFTSSRSAHESNVSAYGDVVIKLKPHVRDSATVTLGDSLASNDTLVARPAKAVDSMAAPLPLIRMGNKGKQYVADKSPHDRLQEMTKDFGYVEAQYHGGLKTSDIAEIGFPRAPSIPMQAVLKMKGIPWRVMK